MRMKLLALSLLFCLPEFALAQPPTAPSQRDRARTAIERTLPLLQRSAQTWIDKQTCSSCHHQGLDVNAASKTAGITPLVLAAFVDDAEMARALLKAGANSNARLPLFGNTTPVIEAAFAGAANVLRVLIAGGADVNARDDEGRTALMYAVWRDPGYADAADILVKAGADASARMPDGTTALTLAEQSTNAQVKTLLRTATRR